MTWHKPEDQKDHQFGCPCCGGRKVIKDVKVSQTKTEEYDAKGVLFSSEVTGLGDEEVTEEYCGECEEAFDDDWKYGKCPSCGGPGYECLSKWHCDSCGKIDNDCSCERCGDCDEFTENCACEKSEPEPEPDKAVFTGRDPPPLGPKGQIFVTNPPPKELMALLGKAVSDLRRSEVPDVIRAPMLEKKSNVAKKPEVQWTIPEDLPED